MKDFKHFLKQSLEESAMADAAKKKLKNMKGKSVSFTDQKTGNKVSGTYKGLKQMGGRSYAHVEHEGGATRVPPHHIHQTQESVEAEGDQLDEANYSAVLSWVGDKMENSNMDIDEMRAAFAKKFGQGAMKHFEKAVDELND